MVRTRESIIAAVPVRNARESGTPVNVRAMENAKIRTASGPLRYRTPSPSGGEMSRRSRSLARCLKVSHDPKATMRSPGASDKPERSPRASVSPLWRRIGSIENVWRNRISCGVFPIIDALGLTTSSANPNPSPLRISQRILRSPDCTQPESSRNLLKSSSDPRNPSSCPGSKRVDRGGAMVISCPALIARRSRPYRILHSASPRVLPASGAEGGMVQVLIRWSIPQTSAIVGGGTSSSLPGRMRLPATAKSAMPTMRSGIPTGVTAKREKGSS